MMFRASCLALIAACADAHGYVTSSRNKKCADGVNANCGLIVYEPQSLEGPGGWPAGGPPDGRIASADGTRPSQTQNYFLELDQQTLTRWCVPPSFRFGEREREEKERDG